MCSGTHGLYLQVCVYDLRLYTLFFPLNESSTFLLFQQISELRRWCQIITCLTTKQRAGSIAFLGETGNIPGLLQPCSNLRFNALLTSAHGGITPVDVGWDWWEPGALHWMGMAKARSSERPCTGKAGWLLPPSSNCGWGLQTEPRWAAVCSGVADSQVIHQKIAVSGLGESSARGTSLQDAQFHRAPVDTISLIPVQEEGVQAKVMHFKAFFAKLRGFAFYLKVSFWVWAAFQVMLKVKFSQLFWAGTYQQRSCGSRMGKGKDDTSLFWFLRSVLGRVTVLQP